MRSLAWILAAAAASWVVAELALAAMGLAGGARRDVGFGVAGPLAVAVGTLVVLERQRGQPPERLTGLLIRLFAAKLLFFGAYVVVMLTLLAVRPIPFVVGLTSAFVALQGTEARMLRRWTS